jgi:hypothetical protein
MLQIALALAASMSVAQVPAHQTDVRPIVSRGGCLPQMDRQFVRFVPEAPSSGPNPLFRLISGSQDESLTFGPSRVAGACIHPLVRTALHR